MDNKTIKQRLLELEQLIAEAKKRLPAHSVKPPVMMELFDLEDEYQELLQQIEKLSKK